ncbi:glycosyltransferase [Leptospira harrisiae]|uniref:Glycosyl transferase family 1 domain-containing protein n=1 Tax=Leptospira harrisiae TaxID=2023189 RepID=A0A2N0APQ9_9LEPT|nr:glycosyltransferase [Leptospira harrisiae]PJZ86278.1 hypothetical protein CH364_08970 [Leptospira harrisiae]PKA09844.1 hypothetical protein CH366_09245 [Leptospira harrisiae]
MKVTLIGTNDKAGGAARAMFRLHQALLSKGIESRILCLNQFAKGTDSINVFKYLPNLWASRRYPFLSDLIESQRTSLSNTLFSYSDIQTNLINHPLIHDADVINLHWINYFVSPFDIGKLLKLRKRIVWTLHDEWPFTGGCHYTSGCNKYITGCLDCVQVNSEIFSLPKLHYAEKENHFSSAIELVAPSKWLVEKAVRSPFFLNSRVKVISNSIEPSWFANGDRAEIRRKFGYDENCFLIGFGADSVYEKRKGLNYLIEALTILLKNQKWNTAFTSKKIKVLFFGNYTKRDLYLDKYADYLGSFSNDNEISEIYQMLDLFVIPSLEDNLPNTMLESMASGTPVLGFPVGGLAETIQNKLNGFLTELISGDSLAKEIFNLWSDPNLLKEVGRAAAKFAFENFSMSKQAEEYIKFFSMKPVLKNEKNTFKIKLKERFEFDQTYSAYLKKASFRKKILNFLFKSVRVHDFILSISEKKRST